MLRYPIAVLPERDGGFVVTFPDFPEAVTQCQSLEELEMIAVDCLDEAIASRMVEREELPKPSIGPQLVDPSLPIALKAALYSEVKKQGLSGVGLARQLGVAETEARRLLDPRHATRADRLEDALRKLGKRLRVEVHSLAHVNLV